jgi:PAS domain S-box-containing protein
MNETVQNSVENVSTKNSEIKNREKDRNIGIPVIGDAPWGVHFCQFYQTKDDLIDVLVPYFKAGLESNEFCLWVTSEPLNEEEAQEAMRKAVPDFELYLGRGQIEIVPHTQWYLKDGVFNLRRVLNAWIKKLEQALANGYDGIRVTGNTAWLEKKDWKNFTDYEEEINSVIGKCRMMAVCTYSIDKCSASEVIDVVRNHQFALIKRKGAWELIESSEIKQAKEALRESEEKFRKLVENSKDSIVVIDLKGNVLFGNKATEELTGYTLENGVRMNVRKITPLRYWPQSLAILRKARGGKPIPYFESMIRRKDGTLIPVESGGQAICKDGKVVGIQIITRDISQRKRIEEAIKESEEKYRKQFEEALDAIFVADAETGILIDCNRAASELVGREKSELVGEHQRILHPPKVIKGKFSRTFKQHRKEKEGQVLETQVITKNGEIKDVAIKANVFKLGDKRIIQGIFRDITEQKQAEEALRASEEKHRVISGITADVVFSCVKVDEEGFAIDWMAGATEKIFGCSAKEIKDKGCWKFTVQPQDLPTFEEKVTGLKPGQSSVCELRITHEDGSTRWIKVSSQVKKDSSNPTNHRLFGACRDITERKKAEEELRETKNYLDNLLNYANAPIMVWDNENKISLFNNAFEALTGYKKESVLGRNIDVLFPPLQKEEILQTIEKATKGEKWQSVEVPILCEGKETRIALWNSANITDKDGNIVTTIAQGQDITERKKMEAAIKQERDMLEAVTENIGAGLTIISKEYRVLWANKVLRQNFGDAEHKPCYSMYHAGDTICPECGVRKVLEDGVTYDAHEFSVKDDKGNTQWIENIVTPIKNKDGTVIAALELGVTITERKLMQNKLAEYSQNLEKLVEERTEQLKQTQAKLAKTEWLAAIGELAAMVGHDLRNPLQAIDNATYYLKNECARMSSSAIPPKAKEMLHVIDDSVNYADKIVRDLSDFSATKKPSLKRIDINMLVKETLPQVEAPRNVEINTELSQLPEIEVDEDQIKRVFLNLIANGIQAMENGGTLTVSTRKAEDFVEISFKDTGVGIPQDNMDKMFSPFFTTKATGMGVGLAICKKIVESHDGTIHLENEVGKGTTFTVKLPIRHETEVENVAKE